MSFCYLDVLPPEIITLILQHLSFSELAALLKREPQFYQLISASDLMYAFTCTFTHIYSNQKEMENAPSWIASRVWKKRIPLPKEHIHQLTKFQKLLATTRNDSSKYEKHLKQFHYHRIKLLMSAWKYNLKTDIRFFRQSGIENYLQYFENHLTWFMDYDIQANTRELSYLLVELPIELCGSIFWTLKHPNYYTILEPSNLERFCKVLPKYFYILLKLGHPRFCHRFPSWKHSSRLSILIEQNSDVIVRVPNGVCLLYFISMFERVNPRQILSKLSSSPSVIKNGALLQEMLEEFEFPLKYWWD
ncbi:predicted protein [Naegleria gruberi]|uniref:Predicted protein n=1 Tax=Naegleria gruberi TaxID=5762 RepID=D2V1Z7_NAEGR|nr:uncharacterized protein NAEGRDRAFT_62750 [Naegleria gruberi]EFC49248.1 predicted protein [Naegleria gruberi]|eukprot:XP_002681992.1 predicted protein [Naegleria gruberi strain NEG-M]